MSRVAGEQHAVVAKMLHAPALERVDAGPLDLELHRVAQHRRDARQDALGFPFDFRVGVPAELEVDAPDIVSLAVHQRRLIGVERRVEPEPTLGGNRRFHPNVGDEKAVVKHLALEIDSLHRADRALRAVGSDQPIADEAIRALRRVDAERHAVRICNDARDLVQPAHLGRRKRAEPVHHRFFEMILLQVDEGRAAMALLGQQVELIDEVTLVEHLPDIPAHAHVRDGVAATEAIEDLERPLRVTDCA